MYHLNRLRVPSLVGRIPIPNTQHRASNVEYPTSNIYHEP
jgi:hypothetical protein